MYLKDPEPKEMVENPPTSVWCIQKGSKNPYTHWNGVCRGCCAFCEKRDDCPHRTCNLQRRDKPICFYRCSPAEWMMGKLDEKIRKKLYFQRQLELWRKDGHKAGDGSWEGEMMERREKRDT